MEPEPALGGGKSGPICLASGRQAMLGIILTQTLTTIHANNNGKPRRDLRKKIAECREHRGDLLGRRRGPRRLPRVLVSDRPRARFCATQTTLEGLRCHI
jgi:hypothetical protein